MDVNPRAVGGRVPPATTSRASSTATRTGPPRTSTSSTACRRERHVLAAGTIDGQYLEIDEAGVRERTVTGATA